MDTATNPGNQICLCDKCYTKVDPDDQFCNSCGYPLKGTKEEKERFRPVAIKPGLDRREYEKRLKDAVNTLYYLTGVFVLGGVILFFQVKDEPDVLTYILPNIILAIVFLALGGYAHKKPLACITSGFVLYIIIQILNIVDNPASFASPITIAIKIAIIAFLIKGIKSAIEGEKLRKDNNLV
ncbi:MAG: zinc-ribbon domain-containing protein [Mucilaginibacter sp.]